MKTKNQIWDSFKNEILPLVIQQYEKDGTIDKPARREAWNNYTDSLMKDGQITEKQCNSWTHPQGLETYGKKPKTELEYIIQGAYGQGWEDVNTEITYQDGKRSLREYDANESYPHRLIMRRTAKV